MLSIAAGLVIAHVGAAQAAQPDDSAQGETPQTAAPGQFEVDEEAAERALERILVQTGVLLLPFGVAEIEPSFTYSRFEQDAPSFFTQEEATFLFPEDRVALAASQKVRRNILTADVQLRFGMPFDSQLELRFPYRYEDQSRVAEIAFAPFGGEQERDGSGFGDIRVGLAKTLLREGLWWPDLVARVRWDSDTGKISDDGVRLGGGFNEILGTLSAVKRQDPLAFIGAFTYEKTFEKGGVEPGRQLSFFLGAALAASPETSLRFLIDQTFVDDQEIDGQTVNGSDQVIGNLTIGASSLVGRGTLLDVSADVGLTDDAADFSVSVSLGKRFNLAALF